MFQDRKVKEVTCRLPQGRDSQDRKVIRDSRGSQVLQVEVFQVNQVLQAVPDLKDKRVMVAWHIPTLQAVQALQVQMEHWGQSVTLVSLADLETLDLLADRDFLEKKELKVSRAPLDYLVQKVYVGMSLDQRESQDQMVIQDHQDQMVFLDQRGTWDCLDLVHLGLLDFLVIQVSLGLQVQVHKGLLDQMG